MINKMKVGKQIQELREARGWRQWELAEKVGVSRSTVSNIESGRRSLTLETLRRFCDVFQINISYFAIESDEDEVLDVLDRLRTVFRSVSDSEREMILREIMKMYLE